MKLSAPGKVFLAGEYAVLEAGNPALVAAIDRKLQAELSESSTLQLLHAPTGETALPFARRAIELVCQLSGKPSAFRLVFENELALGGQKLGLGGSAASCVIAIRAACIAQGLRLSPEEQLSLAASAHFLAQGSRGSSADVAACALGGLLSVRVRKSLDRPARELVADPPLAIERLRPPRALKLSLAFSGRPASSSKLVSEVLEFQKALPHRFRWHAENISEACRRMIAALDLRDDLLAEVRRAAAAMAGLGEEAKVPIVTSGLAAICARASALGAAAKPSGAGGGDCAVVFAFDGGVAEALEAMPVEIAS